jgi:hypothetical protein
MRTVCENDQGDLSGLSCSAQLVLDYVVRYQTHRGNILPVDDLVRSLRGAYPLFRYLLSGPDACDTAVEELRSSGWFVQPLPSSAHWRERLRRNAVECIKFSALEIVARIPLRDLGQVVDSMSDDDNVASLNEDLRFVRATLLDVAASISKQFSKALLEVNGEKEKHKLIEDVALMVEMKSRTVQPLHNGSVLPLGRFESMEFAPGGHFASTVALFDCRGDLDEHFKAAAELADGQGNFTFLTMGESESAVTRLKKLCKSKYAVLICEDDLKRIALSRDRIEAMRQVVFPQIRPSTLSPFRFKGPVTGDSFVGRKAEMHRVLNSSTGNFVVLGARTIGKSSLLLTMRDRLISGVDKGRAIPVFVDATQNHQLRHFQQNLMQAILRIVAQNSIVIDRIDPGEDFFEDLAAGLRESGHRYFFMIDEVDNLLEDAKITRFEEFVRSVSNSGTGRFVISGYRTLRVHTEDRESFFFNLFEPIVLNPLSKMDASNLVRKQMARINVGIESDQVVERILDRGSTFAAYLQEMCHRLLVQLDEPDRSRVISIADVDAVYESEGFTNLITSAVTVHQDRPLEVLERLILYWAAECPAVQFTEEELLTALTRYIYQLRITEVRNALQYLTLTYLLSEAKGRYSYYLPHLREKLRQGPKLENMLLWLSQEYRSAISK